MNALQGGHQWALKYKPTTSFPFKESWIEIFNCPLINFPLSRYYVSVNIYAKSNLEVIYKFSSQIYFKIIKEKIYKYYYIFMNLVKLNIIFIFK